MNQILPDEKQWISLAEAMGAWASGDGSGIKIAVIDSGIDVSHDALRGLELVDDVAVEEEDGNPVEVPGEGKDLFGHGTAIAHIIRSVAPAAQIGSFRVLGSDLNGKGKVVRAGVKLAMEKGYHVLNCSFGFSGVGFGGKLRFVEEHKQWLDEAYIKGIHVVSACNNFDFQRTEWPGHFATSISVDKTRCAEDEFFFRPGNLVEFAAKGYAVRVPWESGWKEVNGSSYAAPRVAGWIARLLSVYPHLAPPQMKGLLRHIALERPFLGIQSR